MAVVILVLGAAMLLVSRPSPVGLVGASPSASPSPSATANASATPSPSPTPPPLVIGRAQPGDAALAASLVKRYEDALIQARWRTASDLIAPDQRALGSYSAFVSERSAYFKSVKGRYTTTPTHDAATIIRWVVPGNYPAAPIWPATPDYNRAFLIEVDYPALAGNNAGWEMLLAAPDASGHW